MISISRLYTSDQYMFYS